jgi:hypothetical protein
VTNLKNAQFYLNALDERFHGCTITLKAELRRTLPMLETMLEAERGELLGGDGGVDGG